MDYNIFKKSIRFKDRNFPVEIFCEEEYEDYYIRGQVIELSSIDYPLLTRGSFSFYHLIIFVLVHKQHIKKFNPPAAFITAIHNSEFCTFTDSTPENFRYFQEMGEYNAKKDKLYSGEFKGINKNPLISIKLEDVSIFENQYLKDSIKAEKDIILLDLSIHLNKKYSWDEFPQFLQDNKKVFDYYNSNCSTRIHSLCGYHLLDRKESTEKSVYNWFDNLYDKIYWMLGNQYLDKRDFFGILSNYGNLSHTKIFSSTEPINITEYIGLLNIYKKIMENDIYPLARFCNNFFYDLIDDLKDSKLIKECNFCYDYFKYKKYKKYCSLKYEGKDCGKKFRNKGFYEKHKKEILPKAQKTTRELREFYKKMGIKK
jgi:hypothetical protein